MPIKCAEDTTLWEIANTLENQIRIHSDLGRHNQWPHANKVFSGDKVLHRETKHQVKDGETWLGNSMCKMMQLSTR